jgi:NADPH-dependent glutamate synthase beta subunit-like oxidoreductase
LAGCPRDIVTGANLPEGDAMNATWTRRDVLRTIAATVTTPVLAHAAPRRTVAIIGAGMAGVSVAWLLDGQRDVVLLESRAA